MTTIADLSRYDPLEAVDLYDGVILNVEDPGFAAKRDRAIEKNIPWGTYIWVYPGQGANAGQKAHDIPTGSLGAWLDFEQAGATAADLRAALARADQLGTKIGVYTYLYILNGVSSEIGNHPLWLAYYPGYNDGSYQDWYSNDAKNAGALLHQYTSSNGTRDLSRVLDDTRWNNWVGDAPASTPAPKPIPTEEAMIVVMPSPFGGAVAQLVFGYRPVKTWLAKDNETAYGLPTAMIEWNNQAGHHFDVHFLDAEASVNLLKLQGEAAQVPTSGNLTADQVTEALKKALNNTKLVSG